MNRDQDEPVQFALKQALALVILVVDVVRMAPFEVVATFHVGFTLLFPTERPSTLLHHNEEGSRLRALPDGRREHHSVSLQHRCAGVHHHILGKINSIEVVIKWSNSHSI